MSSVPQGEQQSIRAMEGQTVTGKKFFMAVAGNNNNTHAPLVSYIKKWGYYEVDSSASCDFILLFCPVVSRVGTDIAAALQNVARDKKMILVVMHHTFDRNTTIAESRRQVEDPNVLLTVDCLFYESELLNCERNDIALHEICRSLGIPFAQPSCLEGFRNWCVSHKKTVAAVIILAVTVVTVAAYYGSQHK